MAMRAPPVGPRCCGSGMRKELCADGECMASPLETGEPCGVNAETSQGVSPLQPSSSLVLLTLFESHHEMFYTRNSIGESLRSQLVVFGRQSPRWASVPLYFGTKSCNNTAQNVFLPSTSTCVEEGPSSTMWLMFRLQVIRVWLLRV